MSIAFDGASAATSGVGNVSSLTVSHTLGGDANRLVLVHGGRNHPTEAWNPATYNGVEMTEVARDGHGTASGNMGGILFRALESELPGAGTYDAVVDTGAGNRLLQIGAASYSGIDQAAPTRTPETAADSATSLSVSPESMLGDLAVGQIASRDQRDGDPTVLAGQTQRYMQNNGDAGVGGRAIGGSDKPGADPTTSVGWDNLGQTASGRSAVLIGVALVKAEAAAIEGFATATPSVSPRVTATPSVSPRVTATPSIAPRVTATPKINPE